MSDRQELDPRLHQLLEERAAAAPDLKRMSDAERVDAVRVASEQAVTLRDHIPGLPNSVTVRKLTVANGCSARLYTPPGAGGPRPLLVYLHGGGWVAGSLRTHEPFCCLLSQAAGIAILSIGYRQPPEHLFPAAVDDAVAAVHWAAVHAEELGADTLHLALGGDSAGGHLAAVAANRLAETPNAPSLKALVLLYPATDHPSAQHRSYKENATGFGLTAESMEWYWKQFAPDADPNDPELSPLRRTSFPALPPTLILTAEYDVLRDEGAAYGDRLRGAGAMVTQRHAPDMNHNFPVGPLTVARFPQCLTTLSEIAGWLRAMLGRPLPGTREARGQ